MQKHSLHCMFVVTNYLYLKLTNQLPTPVVSLRGLSICVLGYDDTPLISHGSLKRWLSGWMEAVSRSTTEVAFSFQNWRIIPHQADVYTSLVLHTIKPKNVLPLFTSASVLRPTKKFHCLDRVPNIMFNTYESSFSWPSHLTLTNSWWSLYVMSTSLRSIFIHHLHTSKIK